MKKVYWVLEGELAGRPGPWHTPWDPAEFAASQIGGIVSLDGPVDCTPIREAGIKHLPVYRPMIFLETLEDHHEFLEVMPPVLSFVDEVRKQGKAALVHCYYGCDRTGAVLSCYLVARENISAQAAIRRIRNVNPAAMSADGYLEVVSTFEQLYRDNPKRFEIDP